MPTKGSHRAHGGAPIAVGLASPVPMMILINSSRTRFYDARFSRAEDSTNVLLTKASQTNRQGRPCCLLGSMEEDEWLAAPLASSTPDGGR